MLSIPPKLTSHQLSSDFPSIGKNLRQKVQLSEFDLTGYSVLEQTVLLEYLSGNIYKKIIGRKDDDDEERNTLKED